MKRNIYMAVLGLGMVCAGPAFAERWVEPVNGTLSAVTMPQGDVMMKLKLPPQEFQVLAAALKAEHDQCTIKEIYPGAADTMILVCGANK